MRRMSFLLLTFSFLATPAAFGAVTDQDLQELRQQLSAMSARLDALASENAELRRTQPKADAGTSVIPAPMTAVPKSEIHAMSGSWTDSIRMDGDFRYRYEKIDIEDAAGRRRNRIRARANIRANIADDVEIGFGLATGGDDPVSTNQTLGEGGSSKSLVLNLAYADWNVADGLHLIAGKYKNPLLRVGKQPLMWDGDWTPEGLAVTYKRNWFFANAMGAWLESDSRNNNTTFSWASQVGAKGEIGGLTLTGGLGYYSIQTKGKSTPFGDPANRRDYFGNTAVEASGLACGTTPDTDCAYRYDYLLTQVFAQADFGIGNWPASVFVDYVSNSDADVNNTGWSMGAHVGQAKDRGQLKFTYLYADKQADASLGLVTDSDFAGGGTDNKGHYFRFTYGVNKTWTVGARYFINKIDVASGNSRDYNRLMIDTQWKWK